MNHNGLIPTLTIDNSYSKVGGLTRHAFQQLSKELAYKELTGRRIKLPNGKRVPEVKYRKLLQPDGSFPTGLLGRVQKFLSRNTYRTKDVRVKPARNSCRRLNISRAFEPYLEQTEAAQAAVTEGRGIVVGPTAVGKSAIAVEIINAFDLPTLVVVPGVGLKEQLTETLRKAFGRDMVGPMGADGQPRYFITVENVQALNPLKSLIGVDLVLVDEFHHASAESYQELNKHAWKGVYHRIGLTATPFRAQANELILLQSFLSDVIYRITYDTAVEKGYIVPMEAYYIDLPKIDLEEPIKVKGKGNRKRRRDTTSWHSVYKTLVVDRADRNAIIAHMGNRLLEAGISTLILTKQVKHGQNLKDEIDGIEFAEGKNKLNQQLIQDFNARDLIGLIGTVGVIGEGIDTKPAEYVILAGGGKSKIQFMQNVGRGFRKYPGKESCKVILFRDPSHKWLLTHFNACIRYLREEYGVECHKLDLDPIGPGK